MLFNFLQAREVIDPNPDNPVYSNDRFGTATAQVTVTINDINDNGPVFSPDNRFRVDIPENIPDGSPLPGLMMTVTDADQVSGALLRQ